ncbi:LOW QUALITY PROTEIN: protein MFI [Lycodopsis pacificus]
MKILRSQEEGPQEPQQTAATIIQKTWRRHATREVFKYFKERISHCSQQDPQAILKTVNPREAVAGVCIRFRLGGITFPPNIYYKIFTHRPITDLCASSYTQPGLKKPVPRQTNNGWPLMQEDRSGRYQRMENNSWRLFCSKAVPMSEPKESEPKDKMDFHYSTLQRQQDVGKWRKKRKIEWLKQIQLHAPPCALTHSKFATHRDHVFDHRCTSFLQFAMAKNSRKTKLFVKEALEKSFQDSSDSNLDYATDEKDLFVHVIDPVIDEYDQGRLQTHPVVSSAQEVMDAIEESGHDEILDRELDELMAWTNAINFKEYLQEWMCLACSHSSKPSKGEHL